MSRKQRILKKRYAIFCEGDTEYNYTEKMRKNQGVELVLALISRVMKNDGYISNDLSPVEIDAIRQTKATLAIEQLQLNEEGLSEIESLVKGDISREEFQRKLKEKYQTHEER